MSYIDLPKLPKYIFAVLEQIKIEEKVSNPRKTLPNEIQVKLKISNSLLQLVKKNGLPLHNDRVGWSLTYLKKAELIDFPKHENASITKNGEHYLSEFKEVREITVKDLKRIDAFKKFYNPKNQIVKKITNESIDFKVSEITSLAIENMIFPHFLKDILNLGYTITNIDGILSIVKNTNYPQ